MNQKLKLSLLILCIAFTCLTVNTVSGAVIDEVIVFHEMDINGRPVEKTVYSATDDTVMVWANMTDIHANDTITFSFWEPSGNLYYEENIVLPSYVDGSPWYSVMSEIEIMGEPAADMHGTWTVSVYNETLDGTQEHFEITASESSADDLEEVIRGYYIWVDEVSPVGEVVIGQNVTIEIVIKHYFPIQSPLVPSIFDEEFELRAETSDEIQGLGEETYTLSMLTKEGDESKVFYAVAYYYIDGNWTFMDPNGYMAFTLTGDDSGSIIPDGIEIPNSLDLSNIDMDKITSALNETVQKGLEMLENIEIPDEITEIEEQIKEQTGIPGYPVEALLVGVSAIGLVLRRRK